MKNIYLDHAATTPVDKRVVDAMLPYFSEAFGNPSSAHSFSREAKDAVTEARCNAALFLGADPFEIVFTSGGTESDNTAIKGIAYARRENGDHIITSKIEHHAVLEPCHFLERQGFRVTYLAVDKYGMVDPDDVRKAITDKTILVSIMHANNEIGTIQPIKQIGMIVRDKGIYFHTDAVQTFGHMPLDVNDLNVDLLSVSGHKFYGPKGVGMLYIRKGIRIHSFMHGGDQEMGKRASTHNVPGIVGFGKAIEIAAEEMNNETGQLRRLRDRLINGVLSSIDEVSLNGDPDERLPNNVNLTIPFVDGESLLLKLDQAGIACSTGSACASSSMEPSHVLMAIGVPPELAQGSLRFSLGRSTTKEDIDYVLEVLPGIVARLRAMN
jgi:cysteine desulfurase